MLYKLQIGSIEMLVGHQNRLPHCVVMLDSQLPKPMCDHKSAYVGHDCIEHMLEEGRKLLLSLHLKICCW